MFKPLAALALACTPLLATAADLAGVWTGTLGKSAITVCFNGAHGANGSYYYQRILTPIQLTQANASEPWVEEGQTGFWQLDDPQGDTLTGTWSKAIGGKSLALMLKRADTDSCASDTYNNPLEATPPAVKVEKKTFAEHAYQVKTQGGQVILKLEGDGEAIDKINRDLARMAINPDGQTDFYRERRNSLDQSGSTSTSEITVEPFYWSSHWITVRFYRWSAGYGRGRISWGLHSWNLQTGEKVDPWTWLGGHEQWDTPYSGQVKLPAAFSTWLAKQTTTDEGCPAVTSYSSFDLSFNTQGLQLSTPAQGDGCDNELSFTWEQLQPVLSPQGQAALPSLMAP
ncbi:hypothetical protein CI807_02015 [Pseudomonas sp. NS1(2017)]|uniref:hypothetical protein n=1 Tax=Pseudomonas sp. NS1(2017) TaxID=2025658 RepID=UPI000BA1E340|nr:hypothetical protein [Pseudomonas sp. NS1(2017)]ASV35002.1 hypothetical protein CI807_02015 [Pseudomonas sp. NS1(2017)]